MREKLENRMIDAFVKRVFSYGRLLLTKTCSETNPKRKIPD